MSRSLGAAARAVAFPGRRAHVRRRIVIVALLASALITGAALTARSPANAAAACDRSATPSSFGSELAAASAGQTICLASGSYGTFAGTSKAVTIRAADGASPQMRIGFGSGDSGFTLEGMTGMGGAIADGARNITVRNSAFTGPVNIAGSGTDGIVFDANTHNWNVGPSSGGANAKIYLENSLTGTLAAPSVTVQNSEIKNGDLDGIHFGGGSGYQIVGNRLENLCDMNGNHTDNMQFDTSTTTNVRIAGNYVYATCATQGITSYDAGTSGVIIEDNVVDIRRPFGIELYADRNSIVRHNTVRFHADVGLPLQRPAVRADRYQPQERGPRRHRHPGLRQPRHPGGLYRRLDGHRAPQRQRPAGHLRRPPQHLPRLRAGLDLPGRPRHRLRRPQQRHPPRHRPHAAAHTPADSATHPRPRRTSPPAPSGRSPAAPRPTGR